jgi:hypothetical protein
MPHLNVFLIFFYPLSYFWEGLPQLASSQTFNTLQPIIKAFFHIPCNLIMVSIDCPRNIANSDKWSNVREHLLTKTKNLKMKHS